MRFKLFLGRAMMPTLAALAITLVPGALSAATGPILYVDGANPACSDTGSGTASQPFCKIGPAAAIVSAGQTVQVASGTYPERVVVSSSGSSSAPIVFTAAPGASVTLSGQTNGFYASGKSWVTINGFIIINTTDYGISLVNSSNITLSNNHVSYSGHPVSGQTKYGIRLNNVTNSLVSDNITDHNSNAGIALVSGSTGNQVVGNTSFSNAMVFQRSAAGIHLYQAPGNIVADNITHDNEDSGINCYPSSDGCLIYNNVTYGNGDHGIDDSFSPNARIIANTVYDNVTAGINVEGGATGGTVMNNVSVDNGIASPRTHSDIRVEKGSTDGTTMDYNLVYLTRPDTLLIWNSVSYSSLAAFQAATGQEAHGIQADPRWASPSGGNFHLLAGSPAIDSANSGANGQPGTDVEGNSRSDDPATPNTGVGPRPYDDRGAYEFDGGVLDHIVISPSSATIPAGGSRVYTAQGFEANGSSFDVTASTTFSISPDGSCSANVCTAITAGPHTVTGNDAGKTSTASLTVTAGALDHLVLAPASATIGAGGSQPYTAQGRDQYDNSLGDVTAGTTFSIAPNGTCTGASCTATAAGVHTVTGTNAGKTGSASLTVTAGALDHLVLAPASATIGAGGSQPYTAQGRDQYDNSLGDVTAFTTFSIAPNGTCTGATCTATVTGAHTVTGTNAGKTGSASLTVTAGALDHLVLAPASATIGAGGFEAYTAQGRDQYDNSLGDVTAFTTFSIAPDGSCTGATCTASAAGAHTVTGTNAGKTGSASLQVNPAVVDHIVISPASASIAAGSSQSYTAEGFDASGNSLGDVTAFTTFSIAPDGSCIGASCTATTAGAHTVTGNNSGKTSSASLSVTAAPLDHLVLAPASATIMAGGSQAYTVQGRDQYDNSLGDVTSSTTFSIAPDGSCTGATCTASVAGAHTVTGTDAGKTGAASLQVNPAVVDRIVISPASATISAGGSQTYTAQGWDRYNNPLGDVTGSTSFSIAPNGSCTGATCTASVTGAHTVTGTDAGKAGTASLTVGTGVLDHIVISPASATISAGGSQAYTAQGFDSSNNSLGDVTAFTTFSVAPEGTCTGAACTANVGGAHTVTGNDGGKTATASLTVSFVRNSGFETDLSGWNTSGSGANITLTRVSGGHSGSWAAQLTNTGSTTSTYATLQDSPNWVTTTTAGTYTGTIWVRSDTAGALLKLKLQEYSGSTLLGSTIAQATLSTSWQQVTVTYTIKSPGSTLDFQAYVTSPAPGTAFYADDAAITIG